ARQSRPDPREHSASRSSRGQIQLHRSSPARRFLRQWQVGSFDLTPEPLAEDFVLLVVTNFAQKLRQLLFQFCFVQRQLLPHMDNVTAFRRVWDVAAALAWLRREHDLPKLTY